MSFSFAALGTKHEVVAQLRHAEEHWGELGKDVAALIASHVEADQATPYHSGHEIRYAVTASGHSGGGSPVSLNVSLQAHHIKTPAHSGAEHGAAG